MRTVEMNGGEALVEALRAEGVELILGIVGSSVLEVFDLLSQTDMKYVGVRHEQVAGHAADAYARVSGRPAVCLVQNGAGLTNLVTGVATAHRAHSPLVAIAGSPVSTQLGTETYQEADHIGLMEPITKWAGMVNQPSRITEFVRRAFREATSPPYGPTFIDVPRDFLYEFLPFDLWDRAEYRPTPATAPPREAVRDVTERLRRAERPVIVAGGGVTWGDATAALADVAERLGAPIVTTYGHNDAASYDFPLTLGSLGRGGSKAAMQATQAADVVLAIGTRLDRFTFLPYYGFGYFPEKAQLIQVDVDPKQVGRNYPVAAGIVADARLFAEQVLDELGDWRTPEAEVRTSRITDLRREWEAELRSMTTPNGTYRPRTEAVYGVLRDVLPSDSIVTTDIGSTPSFAYSVLRYRQPRSLIPPLGLGGVGFSLPAAVGAKLAAPDRPVAALMGDGAFTMALPALFTAVEQDLDMTAIVMDNDAWGAEKANQLHFYESNFVGTNLDNPKLAAVAEAMGAHAVCVEDLPDVEDAVRRAIAAPGPSVVQIKVDPESFPLPARRDALKKPVRGVYS